MLVTNYTGDLLNFGLAAERLRAKYFFCNKPFYFLFGKLFFLKK